MFLPKQRAFLLNVVDEQLFDSSFFSFSETEKELRATHKSSGFYFRIVELDLSRVRVNENTLYVYYTPSQYGVTVNPTKETHHAAETWEIAKESFIKWLDWIKQEYEEPQVLDGSFQKAFGLLADAIEANRPALVIETATPLINLHPTIQAAASSLFATGHYRQALLDAYIAVDNAVREKSQLTGSGTRLMETAFSPNNPVLKIGDSPDEQQGFLALFRGAMLAIRNPKAHSLNGTHDAQRALEWLSFASVLLRNLDETVLTQPPASI